MKNRRRIVPLYMAMGGALGIATLSGALLAQPNGDAKAPPAHAHGKEASEKAEQVREKTGELRNEAKELRNEAKELGEKGKELGEKGKALGAEGKALGAEGKRLEEKALGLGAKIRDLAADTRGERAERRNRQLQTLRETWGVELLAAPPVRAELKTHAWRMARLERMQLLANDSTKPNKAKLVARVDKLIEKERERHQRHMDQLKKDPTGKAQQEPAPASTLKANDKPQEPPKALGKDYAPGQQKQPGEGAKP